MLAARLYEPYNLKVEEVQEPEVPNGWVLLKVRAVGICGTDKAFYRGTYPLRKKPIILGHEVSGEIVEVGRNVPKDVLGSRVTTEINVVCGKCWFCTHGLRTHCPYREALGITIDGGMAENVAIPYVNIHEINLKHEIGVFVEPLAAVIRMAEVEPPKPGSNIAVLGSGTIGLLSLQVLKLYAPKNLILVVREDSPKRKIAEKLGIAEYIVTFDEALRLKEKITPEGAGFDYVVEASGNPNGLNMALDLVRPRGVIAAKSTHGTPVSFNYTKLVVNEVRLISSRCGPFEPAIKLLEENIVKVGDMITSIYALTNAKEAFEKSLRRDQIKVIIKPYKILSIKVKLYRFFQNHI